MVSRATFQHEALEHSATIRVVELSPAEEYNDEIICQLRVVDLDESPDYEAVSYVWGSENDKADIQCDGKLLRIPRNLATALRRLRFRCPASSRVLWSDSICIDQTNTREKSHQVRIMKRIFESASRVLIWLGWEKHEHVLEVEECMDLLGDMWRRLDEVEDSPGPEDLLSDMWRQLDEVEDSPRSEDRLGDMWRRLDEVEDSPRSEDRTSIREEFEANLEIEAGGSKILKAFIRFLENPWFHRAWTFQEYVVAKDWRFFYGRLDFTKDYVIMSLLGLDKLSVTPHYSALAGSILLSKQLPSEFHSLRRLLKMRRGCGYTHAVDIVYSLLGLARDAFDIVPDYEKDFLQVFSEAMLLIIRESNDLTVLGYIHAVPRSTSSELPSWLPDWRVPYIRNCEAVLSEPFDEFCCAGDTVPEPSVSSDFRKLTLRGFEIDSVRYLCPNARVEDHWMTHGSDIKALMNALSGSLETFDSKPSDRERTDCDLYELVITQYIDDPKIFAAVVLSWWVGHFAGNPQFMVTQSGRLGLAPRNAELGDVVAVFLGGRMPLLLRPTTTHQFLFVGQCHIHQMMHGEAMELHAEKPMVDFVLV